MVIPVHDVNPVRRTPWVTYLLAAVNVVVLLLTPVAATSLRARAGRSQRRCTGDQVAGAWRSGTWISTTRRTDVPP